ncbi:MAG: general secretion pathway protein GspL [Ferruginibacter sp.]|nr:general secretion pathway protein GspL [Rhodoferax sp.]
MSTLIVLLPLEPATGVFDYVLTSDGRSAASHDRAAAALLPRSTELVAVVPAQALSWHSVQLPKGSLKQGTLGGSAGSPRLRAVLEGLLEDRLLEEPTELHFALQPDAPTDGPVWVAACNRVWLRTTLAMLEAAHRKVARIVPECAPDSLHLQVIGTPELPQLLSTSLHGVSLLPLNAATLAMAQAAHTEAVELVAEPAVAALAEQLAQRPVTLQQASERWLDSARGRWDLAQFDLSNSTRSRAWKGLAAQATVWLQAPQWQAARWGLALLLLAQIVGLNAWAWKESDSLEAKRIALRTTLTQAFPGVKVVVDAPVQMGRELALLRQTAGATSTRDLEAMLNALGNALPPPQAATALDFAPGEARLKGLPTSSDSAIAEKLRASGYSVRAEGNLSILQPLSPSATGAAP